MKLTDTAIRNAKPQDKPYKIADGGGMYLQVNPTGSKYWRLKYRFNGKQKVLALGIYPEISLKDARERRELARKQLAKSLDPSEAKKEHKRQTLIKVENSFEVVAREWLEQRRSDWTTRYTKRVLRALENDLFKPLGYRPIAEIKAPELLAVLREIEGRDVIDGAHRALQYCGQIFRYAIVTAKAERDITTDLRGALKTHKPKHHANLSEQDLPEFLQKLERYDIDNEGDLQTKLGLQLLLLTFVRTGELRGARWDEIDLIKKEWHIPAERMKMREKHIVPLSKQALEIIEELRPISSHRTYLFPNRNRPSHFISENTLLYAMYRMGYHSRATPHGLRGTASTILNEQGFRSDVIERQLAHAPRNKVRAAYNHAQYLLERQEMMQWWGDFLDRMATGGKVLDGRFKNAGKIR
jgi:integrase